MKQPVYLLLFLCLLGQDAFTQTKPPSQKEVQAQIQQARTESQQMIIQLENDIAEARKRGDDIETIQELQKQLATIKKALGVVDKAASMTDKRPKATEGSVVTVPPYKSPYNRFYKQAVIIPTEAQAKDKLLWYRGKKINQNTLVTTGGRIIQHDRQNNRVLVQYNEKKDTNLLKLVTNLTSSRQWTTNLINDVAGRKNSSFDYPLMMMTIKELDFIEKVYDKLADNTIKLPATRLNSRAGISSSNQVTCGPSSGWELVEENNIDPVVQMHQELKNLMNNPPPLDFPPPPKHEHDLCYYCDTTRQAQFYKEQGIWFEKFDEYEAKIIQLYLSIQRYCALTGCGDGIDLFHTDIPTLAQDVKYADFFALNRMEQKVKILQERYGRDVYRYETVIVATLSVERFKALMGLPDEDFTDEAEAMLPFFEAFETYIKQEMARNNYNVVLNYGLIFGYERQRALLGVDAGDDDHSDNLITKVHDYNHFAFTMDIEFQLVIKDAEDKDVMRTTGYLTTPQKTYVSLGRKECKFQLYLYDPDYYVNMREESLFEIPLSITEGVKLIKEKEDWKAYNYSGPGQMKTVFPSIRIDFCANGVPDSALMDVIRFSDQDLASVTSPDELAKKYTLDMQEYVNLVIASITKVEADRDAVFDITGDILTMQSNTTVTPTGYGQLDQMQLNFNMLQQQLKIKETITLKTKENPSVVLFDAQNESPTLINKSVNMAGDRGFKIEMKKALVKLKVEHEPL